MILDSETQRDLLTQLFKGTNFPGGSVEVAYELRQAIREADVQKPEGGDPVERAVEAVRGEPGG